MPASKAQQDGGGGKRAATSKKARTGEGTSKGRQQKRIDLPYDVLLLIAEKLDPPTLLSLARVNKSIRFLLTSKSTSKSIWKKVLKPLGLPELETDDMLGPSLVALLYERVCEVCGKHGARMMSFTLRFRWHKECESKIIIRENQLLTKMPAVRQETLRCLPHVYTWVTRGYPGQLVHPHTYRNFIIDQIRIVNFELLDYVDASELSKNAAIQAFVDSKKDSIAALHSDADKLETAWRNAIQARRDRLDVTLREQHSGKDYYKKSKVEIDDVLDASWRFVEVPCSFTFEEWNYVYRQVESVYIQKVDKVFSKALRKRQVIRRDALRSAYDKLEDPLKHPISFPIFLDLPIVRQFWETDNSQHDLDKRWTSKIRNVQHGFGFAKLWVQSVYSRTLCQAFYQLGKPLSFHDRVITPLSLLPPLRFSGVQDPLNVIGLHLDTRTPLTLQDKLDINLTLERYSSQAWTFNERKPMPFSDVRTEILAEVNDPNYEGPLFPSFDTYWHLTLLQILEKAGIDDGPFESTSKLLDQLGANFLCGICSSGGEFDDIYMSHLDLLDHLKSHDIPTDDTPSSSLITCRKADLSDEDGKNEGVAAV